MDKIDNILEESLLNDLDMILLENYPPIFLQFDKKVRDIISNIFAIGPNSRQVDINREDVRKYAKGLIITTDEDFTPIGYMVGSNVGRLPTSPFDIGDIDSRLKMIKNSTHFFYITPDEEGWKKIHGREERGKIEKPGYEEYFRKRPTDGFGIKVKREIPIGYKEEFSKRIEKYIENKYNTYKKLIPLIKNNLEKELEKNKKIYIEKIKKTEKDFPTYGFNKKYISIVDNIRNFDNNFYEFIKNHKEFDKENINNRINNLSRYFESLKKQLKEIKTK